MFLATINVPGYLPMDDEPPVFETAEAAWEYLLDQRRDSEDHALEEEGDGYSSTFNLLEQASRGDFTMFEMDSTGVGTIYGTTPGYDGDHDLGLAYCVTVAEEDDDLHPRETGWTGR